MLLQIVFQVFPGINSLREAEIMSKQTATVSGRLQSAQDNGLLYENKAHEDSLIHF